MKTLTQSQTDKLLKLEFQTYLATEKELESVGDDLMLANDIGNVSESYRLNKRYDLLEAKLKNQVNTALEAFSLDFEEYIEKLNNYSESKN